MDRPIETYWQMRLQGVKEALEANNFEVFIAGGGEEAKKIVLEEIWPKVAPRSVSWGGSVTFTATGTYAAIKEKKDLEIFDPFEKGLSPEKALEIRRKGLLVDLYITGTNAVTETGELVNLDMTGNRVAAITFGPKNVVIMVGRNKIVPELDEAMFRIKNYAAPTNAMRLDKRTPCVKTAFCEECKSADRICNTWTITEKSYPKGRVKVVLINADLGL